MLQQESDRVIPCSLTHGDQLMNNPQFVELLAGEDETALQYLKNLTVEEYEDPNSGYKISFVS